MRLNAQSSVAATYAWIRQWPLQFRQSVAAQIYGVVGVLCAVAWLTFYWGHLHQERSGHAQVRQLAWSLSVAYAEHLTRRLGDVESALQSLADGVVDAPHATQPLLRYPTLDALLDGHGYRVQFFNSAGLVRADHRQGRNVPVCDRLTEPPSPNDRSSGERMEIRIASSDPGAPLLMQKRGAWGAVILCLEPGFLTDFADRLDPADRAALGVLSGDSRLLAYAGPIAPADAHAAFELPISLDPISQEDAQRVHAYVLEEQDRMVARSPIEPYGLTATVAADIGHYMAADRTRKYIIFAFALVFPLIVIMASRLILHGMERRRALERTLRARDQLAASVFTHAREGIIISDTQGTILDVNATFSQITGYTRAEAVGNNPRMLHSGKHDAEFFKRMWEEIRSNGHWSGDVWNRRKNGELFAALLTISAVRDGHGAPLHYVALFTDVTETREQQQRLAHLAHYDALSSLPNRVLLADRLRQAMAQCRRAHKLLVVAFLDLDGFKEVNDAYGHEGGDKLLIEVAQQLQGALREGDTLARIGGDEFVAVLVDLHARDECYPVLQRLLDAARRPLSLNLERDNREEVVEISTSVSIGFTFYPQDGVDADQLLRQADQAMYQSKRSGKNRYHLFDVAHDTAIKTQMESLERLATALVQSEFRLHYQPKVDYLARKVIGLEALIRWHHPDHGVLLPGAFLPAVESSELSIDLGEWVIDRALADLRAWQHAGLDVKVSVNIGARQLQHPAFPERLGTILARHADIPPSKLELEILESSAMEDMAMATENIHRCQNLGVGFALDDFGTGYSSLTYLKRLPAQTLKIDQSFVRDMLDDPSDLAIVKSIIGLAKVLNRTVIAEGAETIAQADMLRDLGCPLVQGYGIARPMPMDQVAGWVQQWQAG